MTRKKHGVAGGGIKEGSLEEVTPNPSAGSCHGGAGVCGGGAEPGDQYPGTVHQQGGPLPCPLLGPPPWNQMLSKYGRTV